MKKDETKTKKPTKAAKGARAKSGGDVAKGATIAQTAADTNGAVVAASSPATKKAKAKKADGKQKPKRVSALDAAAQVLAKAAEPMTAQQLIVAMAEKGLWKSPGGKTPHATLYAAMIREINAKGKEARFAKVDRGMFAAKAEAK